MNTKKILIFGVFDGIHEGHLSFIKDAKKEGDHLVAIVARDSIVKDLKGKLPKYNERERIKALLEVSDIDMVLLGDSQMGEYNILREVKPDIVFLGYDQEELYKNLNKAIKNLKLENIKIMRGVSHKGEFLHSSILNTQI